MRNERWRISKQPLTCLPDINIQNTFQKMGLYPGRLKNCRRIRRNMKRKLGQPESFKPDSRNTELKPFCNQGFLKIIFLRCIFLAFLFLFGLLKLFLEITFALTVHHRLVPVFAKFSCYIALVYFEAHIHKEPAEIGR